MSVTMLKHLAAILYVLHTGGVNIMNVDQVTKLWASLSPELMGSAHGHLPRDEDDGFSKETGGRSRCSNDGLVCLYSGITSVGGVMRWR